MPACDGPCPWSEVDRAWLVASRGRCNDDFHRPPRARVHEPCFFPVLGGGESTPTEAEAAFPSLHVLAWGQSLLSAGSVPWETPEGLSVLACNVGLSSRHSGGQSLGGSPRAMLPMRAGNSRGRAPLSPPRLRQAPVCHGWWPPSTSKPAVGGATSPHCVVLHLSRPLWFHPAHPGHPPVMPPAALTPFPGFCPPLCSRRAQCCSCRRPSGQDDVYFDASEDSCARLDASCV